MSTQPSITVVLANRPRLFRELLQHALKTAASQFRVVEAADAAPSRAVLQEADWLVVDEEATTEVDALSAAYPHLNILAVGGRGGSVRMLAPEAQVKQHPLSAAPTLSELLGLLSQEQVISNRNAAS
jgi:hypothetical protein